jgi:hypothetical protein
MYPKEQSYIPNSSMNIEKRIKTYAEYMRNYRTCRAHDNKTPPASRTSTDPTPAPIIYSYNQAKIFLKEQLDLVLASIRSFDKMWTVYPA